MEETMAARYWCHMCSQMVNPTMESEIKCPFCQSGFIEEMSGNGNGGGGLRDVQDPETEFGTTDRAMTLWAPILLGMMSSPRRRRRFRRAEFGEEEEDNEDESHHHHHHHRARRHGGEIDLDREFESLLRRRRRSSGNILQLLQGIRENVKDIIACGFDVTKTFIFSNFDYVSRCSKFYENIVVTGKCVTRNKIDGTFGFTGEDPVAKYSFPAVQAVPSFSSSFPHLFEEDIPCLIPCAIDQDPYFRMTRDVAPRLGYRKPALIESSFFPALRGKNGKMSASDANSAIYMNDSAKDIKKKINGAVSGGRDNMDDHKKYGANLEEDIPFKYLSFFLEDDAELEHIRKEYGEGRMLTGAVKMRLTRVLTEIVENHRRARAAVTEQMVDAFMAARPLPSMFE